MKDSSKTFRRRLVTAKQQEQLTGNKLLVRMMQIERAGTSQVKEVDLQLGVSDPDALTGMR